MSGTAKEGGGGYFWRIFSSVSNNHPMIKRLMSMAMCHINRSLSRGSPMANPMVVTSKTNVPIVAKLNDTTSLNNLNARSLGDISFSFFYLPYGNQDTQKYVLIAIGKFCHCC